MSQEIWALLSWKLQDEVDVSRWTSTEVGSIIHVHKITWGFITTSNDSWVSSRQSCIYVLGSKLQLFSYGRDGHQPHSRGLYTHEGFPVKGGMTIPNIKSLDPGTHEALHGSLVYHCLQRWPRLPGLPSSPSCRRGAAICRKIVGNIRGIPVSPWKCELFQVCIPAAEQFGQHYDEEHVGSLYWCLGIELTHRFLLYVSL